MAESPFFASANTNTTHKGSVWTVLVQPSFVDLVFEAAVLVTKGTAHQVAVASGLFKTFTQPSEFALRLKEAAQACAGRPKAPAEKDDTDDGDQPEEVAEGREPETVEMKESKSKIVQELWSQVQPGCFTKTDDRELEATVNLFLTLLLTLFPSTHSKFRSFSLQLLEAIATAEGKTTPYGRYSALFTLFNALPAPTDISENQPPLQLTILSRLADMAAAHVEDLQVLLPSFLRLPSYLAQWNMVSSRIGVTVINKVIELCEQSRRFLDAFNLGIAFLSSRELARVEVTAELSVTAEACVRLALTLPDCYAWDLLDDVAPISRYLESHPEGKQRYATLLSLLKNPGSDFERVEREFHSNDQLQKVMSEDAKLRIQRKARLLCLTELCGSRVGGEVKYSEVKECLKLGTPIEEDDGMEVEEWIINAIKAKLITARLHQPSEVIFVTKVTYRSFGPNQWNLLQDKLKRLDASFEQLVRVVDEGLSSIPSQRQGLGGGDGVHENKGPEKMMVVGA